MPGLLGFIQETNDNEQILENMINSMMHQDYYCVDKYVNHYFGFARIHYGVFNPEIQPIFNEDKSLCIFFYGKIYDYQKGLEKLKLKYKFKYGNDPEFCLYSYMEYGYDFVKSLNGSFVLAIYDFNNNKIIIINDRYGLRPLYYTVNNNKLFFASEIKAILQDKTFKKELNDEAVADWFAFGKVIGNKTLFKDITVLPPASIFVYDGQNLLLEQYWEFNYKPDYTKSENEFADELVKTFKKAVRIRMRYNYRYGVSLSGGLDSRVIIAAIEENKKQDILSFSYGPLDCDEVKIAERVSAKAHTKFIPIEISPEMIINNSESEIFYLDGLSYVGFSFIPPILTTIIDNVDVVFDGYEFDLILGGSFLNEKLMNNKKRDELFKILYCGFQLFSEEELIKLFCEEYYEKIKNFPFKSFKKEFDKINEKELPNFQDKFFLQNHARRFQIGMHILYRVILENSTPTFDNDLIDLILTIPPELRFHHKVYRKFLHKISPELARIPYDKTMVRADSTEILWRIGLDYQIVKEYLKKRITKLTKIKINLQNKRSYVNFDEWFRTNENWKKYFKELLLTEEAYSKKYINQKYVKTLIDEQEEEKNNNEMKILFIASFELFLRVFMKDDIQ